MHCSYDLEEERVIEWAKRSGYRRILLQAPDGMKACARKLAEALSADGFEVLLSASHCWGGCDVAVAEMERAGCDALVHVGHHGPVRFEPPRNVLFVPGRSFIDVGELAARAASKLVGEGVGRVGVVASVQHVHAIPAVQRAFIEQGIEALTSRSPDPYMQEGLIIGCDVRAAERLNGRVDAFVVVAGGVFHALGVALATGVRTYALDPYARSINEVGREVKRVIALRVSHLSSALDARDATLVVSLKPGQRLASEHLEILSRALESRGIRKRLIVCDDVSREALEDFGGSELYVNLACPRLATDDPHLFPGPVVNPCELLEVLEGGLEAYEPRFSVAWWAASRKSPLKGGRPPQG